MKQNAIILICTRPESKRFPGKVFKEINRLPAIEHILQRIKPANIKTVLCVPTGCNEYDDLIFKYDISVFEGRADSPLHRMAECLIKSKYEHQYVIRITHDDILIDAKTMIDLFHACSSRQNVGYGFTPDIVEGAGVEIIHRDNLLAAAEKRNEGTEFVSYFVKSGPRSVILKMDVRPEIRRNYRMTMDYYEDYVLLETVLREVGNKASLDKIVDFVDKRLYLLNINKMPLISVYTCAKNASKTIDKTILSLISLDQYSPYEYIFLDDGSTDNTLEIATQYSYEPKIKYLVNECNLGLASSSNIALDHCRGQYVMRLDADDLVATGTLKTLKDVLTRDGAGIVYPSYTEIDEKSSTISTSINPRLHHHAGCAMMDKRMINEIRFTDGLKHFDGLDLYNRVRSHNVKISYFEEPVWYYRKRKGSLSSVMTDERKKTLKKIRGG